MSDPQLAVLIDVENTGLTRIAWLFEQLADEGRLIIKRAYADWSDAKADHRQVLGLGIEPIHLFKATAAAKNASDLRLAMDAIDLLYQAPVDTFVLVSSDSDFLPVVSRLKAAGKRVIGAGRQNVAEPVVHAYDRFLFLDEEEAPPKRRSRSKKNAVKKDTLARAFELAQESDGTALGSKLHLTMQKLDPAFDFRRHGFRSFSDFLEATPGYMVERSHGPGDIRVRSSDSAPGSSTDYPADWHARVHERWSEKAPSKGDKISGPAAAIAAASALGASKLSDSEFKNLDGLLNASEHLSASWRRNGNELIRR